MKKEIKSNDKKELIESIKGTSGFFLYFILSYTAGLSLLLLGIDYNALPIIYKEIYLIIHCIVMMLIFFFLYKKDIQNGWKDLKKNWLTYLKKYIKVWFFALAVMYVSNLAITLLRYKNTGAVEIASNEQGIRDTLKVATTYVFVAASFYAPWVEELTFRHSLRKIFKNDILFIFISALTFGGLHVFKAGMTWFDLLYLIPYCTPGVAFAYIYLKTKNITTTISLHMIHNTTLMILQLILLSRGLL